MNHTAIACLGLLLPWVVTPTPAEEPPKSPPAIYDEKADGGQQIDAALAEARQADKRVLLQFGANWCGWCHRLHALFAKDSAVAAALKTDYVVVLIDVNKGHNDEIDKRYGNPTKHGLPVVVVLDSTGKRLTTQDTSAWEVGKEHDPKKVLAFLKEWAPKKTPSP